MADVKNVLLVGVGGQGTILASKILSNGLAKAGYDVKMSEIHGMAQRGGSVTTHVRFGKQVYAPVIGLGQADILVCFEAMEALRWLDHLKPDGKVIVNDYRIPSVPILIGKKDYPEGILELIQSKADTMVIDAASIAKEVGNAKTMNIVLLGAMLEAMELNEIEWSSVIKDNVKKGFYEVNMRALEEGKKTMSLCTNE